MSNISRLAECGGIDEATKTNTSFILYKNESENRFILVRTFIPNVSGEIFLHILTLKKENYNTFLNCINRVLVLSYYNKIKNNTEKIPKICVVNTNFYFNCTQNRQYHIINYLQCPDYDAIPKPIHKQVLFDFYFDNSDLKIIYELMRGINV